MKVDIGNVKLARRDLLKLTSASVVATTLVGASATLTPLSLPHFDWTAQAATTAPPRVAVGFWNGRLDSSFSDAGSIEAGSGQHASTAHVTVATGCPPEDIAAWDSFRAAGLTFDLRPNHEGALHAWRHQVDPVTSTSPLASYDIPVDAEGGLRGWIDYRANDGKAAVPFQIGANGGLQNGTYLIMLSGPGDVRRIDWSPLTLNVIDGGQALALRDERGQTVRRPHVVLEVYLS
ncbi:MAG: hypothetical protein M9890_09665 [Thermomicrobiales bacterium]|nr:hypothetical protein [Thermomicrobiales bacterium]